MSFDLKIFNGDLQIGANGDLQKVENTDKLVQDVLKLLMTKLGGNPFFPWYGSLLSSSTIGNTLDVEFVSSMAENQIRSAIETLQNLQREQSLQQKVTPSETLAAVKSVSVIRSQTDPTFYEIYLAILTKSLRTITTAFRITL